MLVLVLAVSACAAPGGTTRSGQAAGGAVDGAAVDPADLEGRLPPAAALEALLSSPVPSLREITESQFGTLRSFYRARRHAPLWTGADGLQPTGIALRSRLERALAAGQDAAAPLLQAAAVRLQKPGGGAAAELELLLGAALLRSAIDPNNPASFAARPAVLQEAAAAGDLPALLRDVLPVAADFWRLRGALRDHRGIAAGGGWAPVPPGPKLALGDVDVRVAALGDRLRVSGDLAAGDARAEIFDAVMDAAVRRFQTRHGLVVDGVVGDATRAALNVPVTQRVALMDLNLKRMLRQHRDWGPRHLMVNAAGAVYRLVEDGQEMYERVAIVGRKTWPTPELEGMIGRLEFNPYWTVPPRIARLELLPRIERDPDYMRRHDMHWVGGMLRQNPGPANPLGKVKFLFANPYDVYLHDTSNPELFARADRHLSHGCVRISGAIDLARRLLRDDPAWPPSRIDEALSRGRNIPVTLLRPIPVHIVYDTAWVDAAGVVNFRDDIYGRDGFDGDRRAAVIAGSPEAGAHPGC